MKKSVLVLVVCAGIVLFLILFVLGGMIVQTFVLGFSADAPLQGESETQADDSIPLCSSETIFFRTSPILISRISSIVSQGSVNPPENVFPSEKMYVEINDEGVTNSVDVMSPGHVWITKIGSKTAGGVTTYDLFMQPCQEVTFVLSGIYRLDESLKAKIDASEDCTTYFSNGVLHEVCEAESNVQVFSESVLGSTQEMAGVRGFSMSVFDTRFNNVRFSNPFRFDFSESGKPGCPLSYFDSDIKQRYAPLMSLFNVSGDSSVSDESLCGYVSYDFSGTLQGAWFKEGNPNFPEDPHLALMYDASDLNKGLFSMGISIIGTGSGVYSFRYATDEEDIQNNVNIPFSNAQVGTTYCYETVSEEGSDVIFIVQLVSENSLQIERIDKRRCSGSELFVSPVEFIR